MFIYLFIISIAGILIALRIEHKKTQKTLLQILKSSCTIDSVQFEKYVSALQVNTNTFKKYAYSISQITLQKVLEYKNLTLKKVRYFIRKKLQPHIKKEIPSEFMVKINSK